jgi:hypothetical protein
MKNLISQEMIQAKGKEYPIYAYNGNCWDVEKTIADNPNVIIECRIEDYRGIHYRGFKKWFGEVEELIKLAETPTYEDCIWNISKLMRGEEISIDLDELKQFYIAQGGWDSIRREFYNFAKGANIAELESKLGIEQPAKIEAETKPLDIVISEALAEVKESYEAYDYNVSGIFNAYGEEAAIQFRELCAKEGLI